AKAWEAVAASTIGSLIRDTDPFLRGGEGIRERAERLPPTNPPVAFQFPGGEMYIRDGSLYVRDERSGEETLIVQPEDEAKGDSFRLSPNNLKVAYALKARGSDVASWFVKVVATKERVSGEPVLVRLESVYWDQNSTGFFYSSPASAREIEKGSQGRRIRYRSIRPGDAKDQRSDRVIFENPEWPNYAD